MLTNYLCNLALINLFKKCKCRTYFSRIFSFWAHCCFNSIFQKGKKQCRFTLQNYYEIVQTALYRLYDELLSLYFLYLFHIQVAYNFLYFLLTLLTSYLETSCILRPMTQTTAQPALAQSGWQKRQSWVLFSIIKWNQKDIPLPSFSYQHTVWFISKYLLANTSKRYVWLLL